MGQPALAKDARYATHVARGERQAELDALIADWSRELPTRELLACLHAAGVPAGLIYRVPEMLDDPHFVARKAIVSRSEEHTSELQSLMRISYAVFCLKKKKTKIHNTK